MAEHCRPGGIPRGLPVTWLSGAALCAVPKVMKTIRAPAGVNRIQRIATILSLDDRLVETIVQIQSCLYSNISEELIKSNATRYQWLVQDSMLEVKNQLYSFIVGSMCKSCGVSIG